MYWFKNALIYRLTQSVEWANLNEKLQDGAFTPCGKRDKSHFGWVAPLVTSDSLIHQAQGNILLVAKRENKILPPDVVKRETSARVTALEEKEQRKLKKTERLSIEDDVVMTLLPQAFSKFKQTALFIDTKVGLIFVDAASAKAAEDALALLRKSIGSLPVVPLAFNSTPMSIMTEWVKNEDMPDWLSVRDEIEILDDDGGTTRCKNKELSDDEINTLLEHGSVTKLALEWEDRATFVLQGNGDIKRLKFADAIRDKNDDILKEDIAQRFDADFVLMTDTLSQLVANLAAEFGGIKEKE